MKHTTLGKTGFQVSSLGFGGAPIGFLRTDQDRAARILNYLLDNGVSLIDTAAMYEGSETAIGVTVSHRRQDFVLVTKCGTKLADVPGGPFSPELISGTVERALRSLRTDVLDVMLLHSCDLATLKKGDALGALVKARDQGKIRFAGYSGDNAAAAYAATLDDVAVIETSINICDQANIDAVLPICRDHNVGVLAKRPIANAAWKDIAQQVGMYQSYAKVYTDRFAAMGLSPADLGFHGTPEHAWPEIALRFTLSQAGLNTAIIGTTNPDNARANIAYAGKGGLPAEAARALREAFKKAEAASGKKWEGQT